MEYRGSYILESGELNKIINIVSTSGGYGTDTEGNKYPLSELGTKYIRRESIMSSPYAVKSVGMNPELNRTVIDQEETKSTDTSVNSQKIQDNIEPTEVEKPKQIQAGVEKTETLSEEEAMVVSAIKVSIKKKSEEETTPFNIVVTAQINFDIDKVIKNCYGLDIPKETIAKVISDHILLNNDDVKDATKNSLLKIFNE